MKLHESPSFFKVLIMDFNHQLRIPQDFSRELERVLVASTRATLRVSSGVTWDVKVEKMGDGNYKFTEGWGEFARDVGLKLGEFMAFWLVGKSLFDVAIFEVSGCDREFPLLDDDSVDDDVECGKHDAPDVMENKQHLKARVGSKKSPLYFEITLKNHQKSRLTLSKNFWEAAGLLGKQSVDLVYLPKHHKQNVVIDHRPPGNRLDLAAGWPTFRKANGLVIGKAYKFEFKPGKNVIQVQKLKTVK
ncbi:transcriptional factor B3 family protein [Striga asiatica]|uniref:Transcriptional factor B3 family protein n=1 Tax=Striga asiatica TaxID=4170 RepID=A0A5A7PDH7_STRAF|nr:transcriptional factor B3 family protein [Striga asiatica]